MKIYNQISEYDFNLKFVHFIGINQSNLKLKPDISRVTKKDPISKQTTKMSVRVSKFHQNEAVGEERPKKALSASGAKIKMIKS